MKHTLDTDTQVFFYEQDHYYLVCRVSGANVIAQLIVPVELLGVPGALQRLHPTTRPRPPITARSSRRTVQNRPAQQSEVPARLGTTSRSTSCAASSARRVEQHEYVARKLLETGDRILIENSWRDDFWGWGANRDGKNMLGVLWMQVRAQMRTMV